MDPDASRTPSVEWVPARDVVGDELLARLVRISVTSLRRYASGERKTPEDVAWRLQLVASLVSELIGSYNDYGIRRWFERRRAALDGATPAEVVEHAESDTDERPQLVLGLAHELGAARVHAQ